MNMVLYVANLVSRGMKTRVVANILTAPVTDTRLGRGYCFIWPAVGGHPGLLMLGRSIKDTLSFQVGAYGLRCYSE